MGDRFYATVRALSLPLLQGWVRLRVEGLENVPPEGPLLVVANHTSYLDPAVLGRACPRKLHFLIKKRVYATRGLGWFFSRMDAIPVSPDARDTTALRQALRRLSSGQAVAVFPEGGRSLDGSLGQAKVGAALLASRSECPVLPVGIRGAFAAMPVGTVLPRPRRVVVAFGKPFRLGGVRARARDEELEEAASRIREEIGRLCGCGDDGRSLEASA